MDTPVIKPPAEQIFVKQSNVDAVKQDPHSTELIESLEIYWERHAGRLKITEADVFQNYDHICNLQYLIRQVLNGGMSQFVQNVQLHDSDTLGGILKALHLIEAEEELDAMNTVRNWISENPDEASSVTGFHDLGSGPSLILEDLKFDLCQLLRKINDWILGWKEIEPVADATYHDLIYKQAILDPVRKQKLERSTIESLEYDLSNETSVLINLLGSSCEPEWTYPEKVEGLSVKF